MKTKASRLTVKQARKAMGMIAGNYSDAQIEEILDVLRAIAEIAYERMERAKRS